MRVALTSHDKASKLMLVPPPGFEPRPRVPKTRVLPLHYGGVSSPYIRTRIWEQTYLCPYMSNVANPNEGWKERRKRERSQAEAESE